MNKGFIDIHCHILPGFDEGASSIEEAMRMFQIARDDGVTGIVATPHILNGVYNNTRETISQAVSELKEMSGILPIYMGAEIRICRKLIDRILSKEIPLINDNRYLLLELPTYIIPPIEVLENIVTDLARNNITPILSHPERNMAVLQNISIMGRLIMHGALSQITAMSITGQLGRDVQKGSLKMIEKGYAHVVASDAHNAKDRPPILSGAYKKVSRVFGEQEAERLFIKNPLKIIRGENIE